MSVHVRRKLGLCNANAAEDETENPTDFNEDILSKRRVFYACSKCKGKFNENLQIAAASSVVECKKEAAKNVKKYLRYRKKSSKEKLCRIVEEDEDGVSNEAADTVASTTLSETASDDSGYTNNKTNDEEKEENHNPTNSSSSTKTSEDLFPEFDPKADYTVLFCVGCYRRKVIHKSTLIKTLVQAKNKLRSKGQQQQKVNQNSNKTVQQQTTTRILSSKLCTSNSTTSVSNSSTRTSSEDITTINNNSSNQNLYPVKMSEIHSASSSGRSQRYSVLFTIYASWALLFYWMTTAVIVSV